MKKLILFFSVTSALSIIPIKLLVCVSLQIFLEQTTEEWFSYLSLSVHYLRITVKLPIFFFNNSYHLSS